LASVALGSQSVSATSETENIHVCTQTVLQRLIQIGFEANTRLPFNNEENKKKLGLKSEIVPVLLEDPAGWKVK